MTLWGSAELGCVIGVVLAVLHIAGYHYYQRRGQQPPWLRYLQR